MTATQNDKHLVLPELDYGSEAANYLREITAGFGYETMDEISSLIRLAQTLPGNPHIVNVGAGAGTTGLAFLLSRPDCRITTVDWRLESHPLGAIGSEIVALEKAGIYKDVVKAGRYAAIQGDSREIARSWDDGKVDMVFIDDGHTYLEAFGDIIGWLAHLKVGGIIAVHDYHKLEDFLSKNPDVSDVDYDLLKGVKPWFGVDEAVNKALLGHHDLIEHVDSLISFTKLVKPA